MMLNKNIKITISLMLLAAMLFIVGPMGVRAEETIEELMSGFDDEGAGSRNGSLKGPDQKESVEDLLEGFEDTGVDSSGNDLDEAGEKESVDDLLDGFSDESRKTKTSEKGMGDIFSSLPFSIDGYIKIGSVYNFDHDKPDDNETDWRGLSSLKTEMLLEVSWKFSNSWQAFVSGKGFYDFAYEINGRDDYTNDVLEDYEKEIELREAWILGRVTDFLDIKVGRQIVVWGRSDNVRVTDVLNPLDVREPGMTDIEDLRLPLWMTRADVYVGKWNLTGIAVHEIRFNKTPSYGSDFYPQLIDAPAALMPMIQRMMPEENLPQHGGDNTEYAMALNGTFSGWDVSFYWANLYNDLPHFDLDVEAAWLPPAIPRIDWDFELKHARLNMVGSAFNVTSGNWLFKGEVAYFSGLRFYNIDIDVDVMGLQYDLESNKKYYRVDSLLGVEYSGIENTSISVDIADRYITNFDEILEFPAFGVKENEFQWFIRLSRTFMNETLTLNFVTAIYGWKGQDGAIERFWAEYDVTDNIQFTGGVVFYESGELLNFENIGKNDRFFFEIKYSF